MVTSLGFFLKKFFKTGHERTIKAKKNIAFSFILKSISIFSGLILIPLTIHYVNSTQYGIWLILSSIIGWFSFFDIGLGNGLKNKLAELNAIGDHSSAKIYVSTTYAILTIISVCLFVVFFALNHIINWIAILNIPFDAGTNFNDLALLVVTFFCIQFVCQIINTILTATHAPFKVSLITVIGQLLSVLIIYILTKKTTGSLLNLILVLGGVPILVQFIASIWYFRTSYKSFSPNFKSINFKYGRSLLGVGGLFFIIQIGALILFQTDNIIVTQLFGPREVTVFNVAYKLFSTISMIFTIIMIPFWSSFTDAYVKKDFEWIKSTVAKMNKLLIVIVFLSILLFVASKFIYRIWLHGSVQVPSLLSFAMAFSSIATCWQMLHVYILNGIGKIRLQLYLVVVSSFVNIPMAIWLGKMFGVAGITFANLIVFIIIGIFVSIQTKRILNNTAIGIFNK